MNFPPETTLRLCRKAVVESLAKLGEARTRAVGSVELAMTMQAIDRVAVSTADVIANLDYQLMLLERRQA